MGMEFTDYHTRLAADVLLVDEQERGLLAWWNGADNGHFPILHLCNCDATIAEDMIIVMAYLAQEPTVYPDAWGYRDAMVELVERWRST